MDRGKKTRGEIGGDFDFVRLVKDHPPFSRTAVDMNGGARPGIFLRKAVCEALLLHEIEESSRLGIRHKSLSVGEISRIRRCDQLLNNNQIISLEDISQPGVVAFLGTSEELNIERAD